MSGRLRFSSMAIRAKTATPLGNRGFTKVTYCGSGLSTTIAVERDRVGDDRTVQAQQPGMVAAGVFRRENHGRDIGKGPAVVFAVAPLRFAVAEVVQVEDDGNSPLDQLQSRLCQQEKTKLLTHSQESSNLVVNSACRDSVVGLWQPLRRCPAPRRPVNRRWQTDMHAIAGEDLGVHGEFAERFWSARRPRGRAARGVSVL